MNGLIYDRFAAYFAAGPIERSTRFATVSAVEKFFKKHTYYIHNRQLKRRIQEQSGSALSHCSRHDTRIDLIDPVPAMLLSSGMVRAALRWFNRRRICRSADLVMFTSPLDAYLVRLYRETPKVFVLSDPFHLMGYPKSTVRTMLLGANLIAATSKALATDYIGSYFPGVQTKVLYWPNCVDFSRWAARSGPDTTQIARPRVGFAGNVMGVTDVDLIHAVAATAEREKWEFRLAGGITTTDPVAKRKMASLDHYRTTRHLGFLTPQDLRDEMSTWTAGVLVDKLHGDSKYHHHNKLYQYLAQGLQVVATRPHGDYDSLSHIVLLASSPTEFLSQLKQAMYAGKSDGFGARVDCARENSAEARARVLMDAVGSL